MKFAVTVLATGLLIAQPSHAFLGNIQAIAQEKLKNAVKDVATETAKETAKQQGYNVDGVIDAAANANNLNTQGMGTLTNAATNGNAVTKASAALSLAATGAESAKTVKNVNDTVNNQSSDDLQDAVARVDEAHAQIDKTAEELDSKSPKAAGIVRSLSNMWDTAD